MDLKIEVKLDKEQLEFLEAVIKDQVAGEVTRQLKFKRNEALNNE